MRGARCIRLPWVALLWPVVLGTTVMSRTTGMSPEPKFTTTHSRDTDTTQRATATATHELIPGTSAKTASSIKSTVIQDTTSGSTSGGPGAQSTFSSTTAFSEITSATSQDLHTQSAKPTGKPPTSIPGSAGTDSPFHGTPTSASAATSSHIASGAASSETATSSEVTHISLGPSNDSHTTHSTTESLSTVPTLVTTSATVGSVSIVATSTMMPTVSGAPTDWPTTPSSSSSSQETTAISQVAQTTHTGPSRAPEMLTSLSQGTDLLSTVTPPAPPSTPNGQTSPETMTHALSPSPSATTLMSTAVSGSHKTETAAQTLSVGSTEDTTRAASTLLSGGPTPSPSTIPSTSGQVLATASQAFVSENISPGVLPPVGGTPSNGRTATPAASSSSQDGLSTPTSASPSNSQTPASPEESETTSNFFSSTLTPGSSVSPLTVPQGPTSHTPAPRTMASTSSETSTAEPTTSQTFPDMSTSPVAPGNVVTTQHEGPSTRSTVTINGRTGGSSGTVTADTTSHGSTTEDSAGHAAPPSASTADQQSTAVSQTAHPPASKSSPGSPPTGTVSPPTEHSNTDTAPTSSFRPSDPSTPETVPQVLSATSPGPTLTAAHTKDSHTTQGATDTTTHDLPPGTSTQTASSITSTVLEHTSSVSTSGGPGAQSTFSSTTAFSGTTSAAAQDLHTQRTEPTRSPPTSTPGSAGTHTPFHGTPTSASASTGTHTVSESAWPVTITSGKVTGFSTTPTPSSGSLPTTSNTASTSLGQTLVSTGNPGTTSSFVSSTNTPPHPESSTTTVPQGPTAHLSRKTTSATSPTMSTSQLRTSKTFPDMPTSPVSPGNPDTATGRAEPSTHSPVTTNGRAGGSSGTVTADTTSHGSTTEDSAGHAAPTSASTADQQSTAVSQTAHPPASQSSPGSPTAGTVSTSTEHSNTDTAPTSSFRPSDPSTSETVPQVTSDTSPGPTLTAAHTKDSHTTQGATDTTTHDLTPGTSAHTVSSIASTVLQDTSSVSTSGGSGAQSTFSSTTAFSEITSVTTQDLHTQRTETTGSPPTSTPNSAGTDTPLHGTPISASAPPSSHTASAAASSETTTSSEVTRVSPAPSSDSHTIHSTTESLFTVPTLVTTPGSVGSVSIVATSTMMPTISGAPTDWPTTPSSSSSSQETTAISQVGQTTHTGPSRAPEMLTSLSQGTDLLSTVTPPAPPSTPNGQTSPETMTHALSPSPSATTLMSTAVSGSHKTETAAQTLSVGSTEDTTRAASTLLSGGPTPSPSTIPSTSGQVLATASQAAISENISPGVLPPVGGTPSNGRTATPAASSSSQDGLSTPTSASPSNSQTPAFPEEPETTSNFFSSTLTPGSSASPLTVPQGPTSHTPAPRTMSSTSSETSTAEPTTSQTFPDMSTSPVAPGNVVTTQHEGPSTRSTVTINGRTGGSSGTVTADTTSHGSTTEDSAGHAAPTSASTADQQSTAVSQTAHPPASKSSPGSPTAGTVSPPTEHSNTDTAPTFSFRPSDPSTPETVPQVLSATSPGPTLTAAHTKDSHTTQGATDTTTHDLPPGTSTQTASSITSTVLQDTSSVSTSGGPGAQSTFSSTTAFSETTSATSQDLHTQSAKPTGRPPTSTPWSAGTDTPLHGTSTFASASTGTHTVSESAWPVTITSGKVTGFSTTPTPSSGSLPTTSNIASISPGQTLASTGKPGTTSSFVSSTNTPPHPESSTITAPQGPTSHLSRKTTSASSPTMSTSQPHTSKTFPDMPTSPVSPGNPDTATGRAEPSTHSLVTTNGRAGGSSGTIAVDTTSNGSTTEDSAGHAAPTSVSTADQQSTAVSQTAHPPASQSSPGSPPTGSVSPPTEHSNTDTAPTSSFRTSESSTPETVPHGTSDTSPGPTLTAAHTKDSHTTQGATDTTTHDLTPGTSTQTASSITSTVLQDTSSVSTSGGSVAQSTFSSITAFSEITSVTAQDLHTQRTETTGSPPTSTPNSAGTDTPLHGTPISASAPPSSHTASAAASSETTTSSEVTRVSPAPSSDSHTTHSTTESLFTVPTLVTTPGSVGSVSIVATSTMMPTISGAPTDWPTTPSSSSSSQETTAISQVGQTTHTGPSRAPEMLTSLSQGTDLLSTVTPPAPPSTPNGQTSPETMTHALSPSPSATTLMSTAVSGSHKTETAAQTLSVGSTEDTTRAASTLLSGGPTPSPSTIPSTSGQVLATASQAAISENISPGVFPPVGGTPSNGRTATPAASSSSQDRLSTPTSTSPSNSQTPAFPEEPETTSNFFSSTLTPGSSASPLTVPQGPTSHTPAPRTMSSTSSETSTAEPTTSQTFPDMSTSPVAPGNVVTTQHEGPSTRSTVTTNGRTGGSSGTVTADTTSHGSTTEDSAGHAAPTSASTADQQSTAVSQTAHPPASQSSPGSPPTGSVSPPTEHSNTDTAPTSSFRPSDPSTSETVPQATSPGPTLTMAHTKDNHTTQGATDTTTHDLTPGTSAHTVSSIASTVLQDTSSVSTSAGPGAQSTFSSTTAFSETTSATSQDLHTQSAKPTGSSPTSTLDSAGTDTPFHGTPTPVSAPTSSHTASGAASSEIAPSGTTTMSPWTTPAGSTATSLPTSTFRTLTTSTPRTATIGHSTAPPVPTKPNRGVPLFPYGPSAHDQQTCVNDSVDFTSPLIKLTIGFPFGSSLRDSLYFTDNGQIIFPESDYQVFSYPNPPRRGLSGGDSVALVAPFWDDADFSTHQGTIFYQEYKTFYDEYNPLVRRVESWIAKFTNTWNYKARWTLKVTWVNALAYPALWTFGTNTYQAILSTDGSKSYALFLYQSGGMQWDAAQRRGNSVIMGFSSGDGYFQNSPLIFRPVWEKYRPDQFLDFNSGLQGLQFYVLHRRERPNYRLKCLQWLNRQPQWPSWGSNQISCPCSWQQGRWDLRFQPTNPGWWGRGSRQLCSFSSWRGGVCCSYGPWGELQEGWRVQGPWQLGQELESQNWCCRWNDKPFFCTLYQQRQPRVSCAGYRPPRPGWMFGDPHFMTLDGVNYTFNGLGDFLLVRAQDGNSSFQLEGRTAQTGTIQATNFIAFAARYKSSRLDPITVRWVLESNNKIHVQLNNETVTFKTNGEDAEGQRVFNTTGIILTSNGSLVSANFDGTVTVSVSALSNILHASSNLPAEYQNHTEGLLGVWNNNPDDDLRMPNSTIVPRESSEERIFHYGMTWKLNGTSLLGERTDKLPANFTPVFLHQLRNTSLNQNLAVQCHGDAQCIFDTLAIGKDIGLETRMLLRNFQQMNDTLNQFPPSIEGERVLTAYKERTERFQYTSDSEHTTFSLRNDSPSFTLFENGTLLWTPSPKPFTLEILARNAKNNLSSACQPDVVACFCSAEDQCIYNQTSRVGNSSLQVAACRCGEKSFGLHCERSRDPCEQCFPGVYCTAKQGCGACPQNMTGNGIHCAALESSFSCQNKPPCPANHCYNHGHCYLSQSPACQPTCTCPPAFIDTRCFLAGNNFTPIISSEPPLRVLQLLLSEEENASVAEVNASVAFRLGNLDVRAFFRNSMVEPVKYPNATPGSTLRHWRVLSEFQYRPGGPVIDFLNNWLVDAVVGAFLSQTPRRIGEPRNNVAFYPVSRGDVGSLKEVNVSTLETHFQCNSYKGYHLVYSPQRGFTCVSPCSENYCEHGGQCQHLPEGPRCSCVPFSIYTPWGEHCEHLSLKLGAFFGILFGSLGALLLLGLVTFVVLRFCNCSASRDSYPLDSES